MNNSRKLKAFALMMAWVLLILPLSSIPAMAQATTGTLRGVVADPNGGVIAGATVTAKNEGTGTSTSPVTTTGEGTYEIAALQPGNYTVTVEAPGFKRGVSTGVVVKVGIVNPLDVQLATGNVSETVTVTANTEEVVQRDQSQISTTIEARRVEDLPSNGAGGGIDTLALLAPGVVANRSGGTNTNGTGLSVNGNRGRSNNFQIDGADNNDLSVGGPALFVDFQDSVQEFQVITNNFSAQYGRNQGAIVNIVGKSGTSQFHGTAFEFHQDNKNLNSLDNIEKASGQTEPNQSLYNVFGGTLGGPAILPRFGEGGKSYISDRLFFFGAYQGIRNPSQSTGSSTALSIVPSEFARLQSTFPGNAVINSIVQYSPFAIPGASPNSFVAGTPGPALISTNLANANCPKAILTTVTPKAGCAYANLGNFLIGGPYDVINLGTATAPLLFQAAQYQRTVSTAYTENYYNVRFDLKATERNNVTVRYLNQKQLSANALQGPSSGFNGAVPATSKNFGGTWTRTISNRAVNEFRATYQRIGVEFGGGCNVSTPGCIPGPAQIGEALTNIAFSGALGLTKSNALATIGPATNLPQGRIGKVYQIADNLNYTLGRHSLIFGAEYKKLTNLSPFLPVYNGAFSFNSATRIVNNTPSTISITGGDPLLAFNESDKYAFVQDDFKIRPNLTLNLGLRYEYTGQPLDALTEQSIARENDPARRFYNPALPLSVRTVPSVPADKNNFAPRIGFAYSPHFWKSFLGEDATVIRGGFSIAYDPAFYNILSNVQNAAPFSAALNVPAGSLTSLTTSPLPLPNNPIGSTVRAAATSSGALPLGTLNPLFLTQTQVAPDFRSPYSEQFSLGVQHQFGRHHIAEVRYVGTHGVGLFQNVNANFFIGPIANGFAIGRTAGGSIVACDASATGDAGCIGFQSFPQVLPPGVTAQTFASCGNNACVNRIRPQAGITVRQNSSQSIYHSMQSRYNGRFLNDSMSLGLAYTWSKTIDDSSEIFAETDILSASAQNPFCINRCERSLSALDRPHVFSANFIYDVPFFKSQEGIVGHLLGGWQLNGTYILTSGATFTPGQSSNATFGLGNTYLTAGDRPFLSNPNADRRQVGITQYDAFFLFGAFRGTTNANTLVNFAGTNPTGLISLTALNATGDIVPVTTNDVKYIFNGPGAARLFGTPFGSSPRNAERGPIFNQLNMSLFKNIKVFERLTVQLRGEAFNVLNHPNPGFGVERGGYLPAININAAGNEGGAFGENQDIELARRVVQVGIRIIF
ncbi:MAG: carboxypeptidase regulatory-like domain-containing protein [Pyrinomonadaceae bacterium]